MKRSQRKAISDGVKAYWRRVHYWKGRLHVPLNDARSAIKLSREERIPVKAARESIVHRRKATEPSRSTAISSTIHNMLDMLNHMVQAWKDGYRIAIESPYFTLDSIRFANLALLKDAWTALKDAGDKARHPQFDKKESAKHYWRAFEKWGKETFVAEKLIVFRFPVAPRK